MTTRQPGLTVIGQRSLSISSAVLLAVLGVSAVTISVGCASPALGQVSKDDSDITDKPEKKPSKKEPAGKTPPAATKPDLSDEEEEEDAPAPKKKRGPSSSSSGGTSSGGTSSGGSEQDSDACFVQCASKNPKAAKLDECSMSCEDEACDTRCLSQAGCSGDPESCPAVQVLMQCGEQCPEAGGGDEQGGPGQGQFQDDF